MIKLDKHSGIVIVAAAVIIASVGYSVFNAMTLDQIQIKWNERGSFNFLTMLNGGVIEVCNSSLIPLSFNGISIVTFWDGEMIGRFATGAATVQPDSVIEITGDGEMTGLAASIFSMYVDAEISGDDFARMDTDAITVMTSMDTMVLGIIPFSITEWYSGQEFFEIMGGMSEDYSC